MLFIKDISDFIKKSLEYFDNQNKSFDKYIKSDKYIINRNNIIYNINKEEIFNCELLGFYDNENKIWFWSWAKTNMRSDMTNISNDLLKYGIKLDVSTNNMELSFLKPLLLNARIKIENDIELYNHLSIISYILKNRILYIKENKYYLDKENKKFITLFYLIK
jgi:hypothetical protein